MVNMAKIYTEEAKYSGEDDSFDFKLSTFHDIYSKADVPAEAKIKTFPTMLKGLALDYYYAKIIVNGRPSNLELICAGIRSYFEKAEHRRSVLSKWNATTLKSVMKKPENEGRSMEECLQLMIKDLRHLQHELNLEFRSDKFIHNKLINGCQDVPACQYACFKPPDN